MIKRFYFLPMYALKVDPEAEVRHRPGRDSTLQLSQRLDGGPVELNLPISTHGEWCLAASEEEARQGGVESARERWPESEGWINHTSGALLFTKTSLLEALKHISDDEETPETPDVIM